MVADCRIPVPLIFFARACVIRGQSLPGGRGLEGGFRALGRRCTGSPSCRWDCLCTAWQGDTCSLIATTVVIRCSCTVLLHAPRRLGSDARFVRVLAGQTAPVHHLAKRASRTNDDPALVQNEWKTAQKITTAISDYVTKLGVDREKSYALYKSHGTCLKGMLAEVRNVSLPTPFLDTRTCLEFSCRLCCTPRFANEESAAGHHESRKSAYAYRPCRASSTMGRLRTICNRFTTSTTLILMPTDRFEK